MRYVALTTAGPFEIGEFPDQDTAQRYAQETYGDSFQAVMVEQSDSVTVTADVANPTTALLVGAAVLVAFAAFSKPRRKSR